MADNGKKIPECIVKANPFVVGVAAFVLFLGPLPASGQGAGPTPGEEKGLTRVPVLLVPGWLGQAADLEAFRERLVRDGWGESEVGAVVFADPVGSNRDHARELDEAVGRLLTEAGASQVDVVAHSMGGLAVWFLLQQKDGVLPVRRVVFLGSPLQGTLTAYLAWGRGGEEMRPGSPFLAQLLAGERPQRWVEAMTIRTPFDLNVVPGSGGALPGLGDRMVCCPTHQGLLDHEGTYTLARDFLLRGVAGKLGEGGY